MVTDDYDYDTGAEPIDDPPWELADQFAHLFGEQDGLTSRTASRVETRLRSTSVTSTLGELMGVGLSTAAEILGSDAGRGHHDEEEV